LPRIAKVAPQELMAPDPASPNLFAGTSGWAYATWKPGFYPASVSAKNFLSFYASRLNSVEVNYTFRALPTAAMLGNWLGAVPANFRFSFKAPQRITHIRRLRDCAADVEQFLAAIAPVASAGKLGLLLFQLPPNFKADPARLAAFLESLPAGTPPLAFEFRHESWFADETYAVLRKRNAALCIAESDELRTPEVHTAAGHTCLRLRCSGGYGRPELQKFAQRFMALARDRTVYVYLKHEEEPTGAWNADELLRLAAAAGGEAR
jgi:uncharacterized protein YecE (DUF72 family)